jgi:hypothetical protein
VNYRWYLQSEHWLAKRDEYKNSGRPQYCLICKNPDFQLHHLDYNSLGKELIHKDLAPFCKSRHCQIHDFLNKKRLPASSTFKFLPRIFTLTPEQFCELKNLYPWFSKDLHTYKGSVKYFKVGKNKKPKSREGRPKPTGNAAKNMEIDKIKARILAQNFCSLR